MEDKTKIAQQKLIKGYLELFPMEAAISLDNLPCDRIIQYLQEIPAASATAVFARLNPEVAIEVVEKMSEPFFVQIFSRLDTHLSARLLARINDQEAEKKLELLPNIQRREIRDFMVYKPDTAGYLMDPVVIIFNRENTIEDILRRIRKSKEKRITNVYVTDEDGVLVGEISLQSIAISPPEAKAAAVMYSSTGINANSSTDEVIEIFEKGKFYQIPVTDINNKLIGVIRNDALMNATREEATENIQAMFGASREERALSKVSVAVRSRLPWLQVNLATAFLASMIVGAFEETIAKITILAVFLPVVAGQSGNTGSQALAVTMRGLALREIAISQWLKVARKEITVGFVNGIAVALVTAIIVYFWASSFGISVVIGLSMIISMMIAGFSGAIIPVALKALGQDPATSSSIILTTVTDIVGFLSFLGLATALSSVLGIV